MIKDKNHFDLGKFITLHNSFMEIPTWTKIKRKRSAALINYINSLDSIRIMSKRNSTAFLVPELYSFTVFKVPHTQTGKMINLRGEWVLLRCDHREMSDYYLRVFRLNEKPSKKLLRRLKDCFRYKDWSDYFNYTEELTNK